MRKKKGFTLIELLGVIVILGIVIGIVSIAYININESMKKSYYKTLEESILTGGGEYFTYNKDSQPKIFADVSKINVKNLIDNKYITEVIDRKGNPCDLNNSFVGAYKDSYDKTNYYVCLRCEQDDYISSGCDSQINYALEMKATIKDSSLVYENGTWTNKDVVLSFKTSNDIDKVIIEKDGNFLGNCNLSKNNNLKTCSIDINSKGIYTAYGETNGNKTSKKTIEIKIDKTNPDFNIYNDSNTEINNKNILITYQNSNITINDKVKDIVDTESGIKRIRYSFEKNNSNLNYQDINTIVDNFDISKKDMSVGKYKLVVQVTDNANNITEKYVEYEIYNAIAKPTSANCENLQYNGLEQTLVKPITGIDLSNNKGINAKSYQVVAKLKENYRWLDATNNEITFTCEIKKAPTAKVPSCNNNLIYNGINQNLIQDFSGENVESSDSFKKNAGSYGITITADPNYTFSNGETSTTINCSIGKKNLTVTPNDNQSKIYGANNPTLTYSYKNSDLVNSETPKFSGALSRNAGENVGSYQITKGNLALVNNGTFLANNYNLIFSSTAIYFKINKANSTNPTLTAYSGTYDGNSHTIGVSGGSGGTIEYSTDNKTWSTDKPTRTNTGTTTVYVRILGDSNHNSTSSINTTIKINKANSTNPTLTSYSGTYDGNSHTIGVSGGRGGTIQYSTDNKTWSTDKPTRTNTGTTTVYVRILGDSNHNTTSSINTTIKISQKSLTITAKTQNLNGTNTIDKSLSQITSSGLLSGHSITSITLTQSTTADTGNGTITPSAAVIKSGSTVVTNNYNITYNTGSLTITTKEYCMVFNKNGANQIDGVSDDNITKCCKPGSGTSCNITAPTITPIADYEVLGWNTSENSTSSKYNVNSTISLTKEEDELFAITKSSESARRTNYITFKLNGANSFTYNKTTYTSDTTISCKSDYGYNGEAIPDSCTITLPTITRNGGNVYGWALDNNSLTADYQQSSEFIVYDEITLNAITSRTIKLSTNANGGTTTIGTLTNEAYNQETGAGFIIPSYDNANMCRSVAADNPYTAYKYIGLTDISGSKTVKYCPGSYIFIENDTTLYAIWNETYGTTKVTSGSQLYLRKGCGTSYGSVKIMKGSTTIYVQKQGTKATDYMWYWVKYGSSSGCASSKYMQTIKKPTANSCDRTDYACNGGTAADVTMTPSVLTLNLKKNPSGTINIDNRCGSIDADDLKSNNTNLVKVSRSGNVITATAVSGSVLENQQKTTSVTVKTQFGCTASTDVVVKNTLAVAPTVNISTSASTSCGDSCYKKGVTFQVTCSSPIVPITDFSVSGATITGDDYNKTATITYSTTGDKTLKATCTNQEGTTTQSKTIKVRVYSSSSACGCAKRSCTCTCKYEVAAGLCTGKTTKYTSTTSSSCSGACSTKCSSLGSSACGYSHSGSCSSYDSCWHS